MKWILIAAGIGVGVTMVAFVLAAMAGGACHCSSPVKVLFPFGALFGMGEGTLDFLLFLLQFPAYAVTIAVVSQRLNGVWTALTLLMILGMHFVAALLATSQVR